MTYRIPTTMLLALLGTGAANVIAQTTERAQPLEQSAAARGKVQLFPAAPVIVPSPPATGRQLAPVTHHGGRVTHDAGRVSHDTGRVSHGTPTVDYPAATPSVRNY
jgi:hypothetical protein